MAGGRLKLKGDRSKTLPPAASSGIRKAGQQRAAAKFPSRSDRDNLEGWARVEGLEEFAGPLMFVVAEKGRGLVLVCPEDGRVVGMPSDELGLGDEIAKLEPKDVSQVLVASSLVPGKYSLKTAHGKYLSSDHIGKISMNKEAVGPSEEWTPCFLPTADGSSADIAIKSHFGKYLSIDLQSNTRRVRCDSDEVGEAETFHIRCHAKRKAMVADQRLAEASSPSGLHQADFGSLEEQEAKKFQSWAGGTIRLSDRSKTDLQEAENEGKLHEALLERRIKMKHDPFC